MSILRVHKAARAGSVGLLALGILAAVAGCKAKAPDPAQQAAAAAGVDPAAANLALVDPNSAPANTAAAYPGENGPYSNQSSPQQGSQQSYQPGKSASRAPARVLGQRSEAQSGYENGESYPQQEAQSGYPNGENYPQQGYGYSSPQYDDQVAAGQDALDAAYDQPIYAEQPPPPLPVYQQPTVEQPNDLWTPGYWSYAPAGYFWVPGAWVAPPYTGALWTPPYWGYSGRRYRFHHGFWGRHIGFYGGIPYGFGYTGYGYQGGYWQGNNFFYNRNVNRINVNIVRNVYVSNVTVVNTNVTRISYNGPGGYAVQPRPAEIAAYREQRLPAMQTQIVNVRLAEGDRQQFFSSNRGRPAQFVAPRALAADRSLAPPLRTTPAFARFEQREAQAQPAQRQGSPQGSQPPQELRFNQLQQGNRALEQGRQQRPTAGPPLQPMAAQRPIVAQQPGHLQQQAAGQQRPAPASQRALPVRQGPPQAIQRQPGQLLQRQPGQPAQPAPAQRLQIHRMEQQPQQRPFEPNLAQPAGRQPQQLPQHEQPRPQPQQVPQREQPRPQPQQLPQREQPRPQQREQPRPQPQQLQQREQLRPQQQPQQREQPRPQPGVPSGAPQAPRREAGHPHRLSRP